MTQDRVEAIQFLTADEVAQLGRCGVSVSSTGLVFNRELDELEVLRARERFMLDLLAESESIGKIFKGLFAAIGVSVAEQNHVTVLGDEWSDWAANLSEFDQVRRKPEESTASPRQAADGRHREPPRLLKR